MGINIGQIDLRIKPKNRLWGCNSIKTAYFAMFALNCNDRADNVMRTLCARLP